MQTGQHRAAQKQARKEAYLRLRKRRKTRRSTRTHEIAPALRTRKSPGKPGRMCEPVQIRALLYKSTEYPVGESNPCLRRERALSWATRRTGRSAASYAAN